MKGLVPCSLELGPAHSPPLAHLAVRRWPEGERQLPAHFPLEGGGVFCLGEKSWGPGLAGQGENMAPYLIPLKVAPAKTMGICLRRCRVLKAGARSHLLHRSRI